MLSLSIQQKKKIYIMLHESGTNLSGGERQRIMLARPIDLNYSFINIQIEFHLIYNSKYSKILEIKC